METRSESRTLERTVSRRGYDSFVVRDIHCTRCADTLEGVVRTLPGVSRATVDRMTGWTWIVFDESRVSAPELREAVAAAGYRIVERWDGEEGGER